MKFFIVGLHATGKQEVMTELIKMGVKCGHLFTNADIMDSRYEFYTDDDIRSIFENKAYVFIKEMDTVSKIRCYEGLSLHEFDNNDVFVITPDEFNAIPNVAMRDEVCFVWLDSNETNRRNRYNDERRTYNWAEQEALEKLGINDFIKDVYNFPYSHLMYFFNEDPQRVAAIVYALVQHPELVPIFIKKFN